MSNTNYILFQNETIPEQNAAVPQIPLWEDKEKKSSKFF
jgi:hypothetical protein